MSIFVDIHKKLDGFSLDMRLDAEDEIVGMLGESGSGKSMTLRCIAGIVTPDSGRIVLNGRTLFDSERGICLTPRQRKVGLLFQDYALFPNMTVEQNIGAGVRFRRTRNERVAFYMTLLRISGLEKRYPRQLSGGQQQRVAIARMMASAPEILLLDEPFSALDERLRQEIDPEFTAALADFHGTVLYVSHDIGEVYRFCGKTIMVRGGGAVESGETKAIFARPQTTAGARLLCCKNITAIEHTDSGRLARAWGIILPESGRGCRHMGIFGDDVKISLAPVENSAAAVIEAANERPRYVVLRLRVERGDAVISATCDKDAAQMLLKSAPDGRVYLSLPPEKLLYLKD